MSVTYTFDSTAKDRGGMHQFDQTTIKNEIMLFSADHGFARQVGGPITQEFLNAMPEDWKSEPLVIDTRVHMLMPGWFPCIPGWHLDDVPRSRADGQPDHEDPEYHAEHLLACIGDASLTTFLLGKVQLEEPDPGKVIYGEWHERIETMLKDSTPGISVWEVPECRLVEFTWQSFHRGTAASKNGWRWFGRATRYTKRPVFNEIRRQVQVYLPEPMAGW